MFCRQMNRAGTNMRYIEAPEIYYGDGPSLFLAGGITGCPDWQREMVANLQDLPLVIFNPRRTHFPQDRNVDREQIEWEYTYLRKATAISFWFPQETLCPIALYELGAWCMTNKKIFLGVHPNYRRIQDIRIQTALVRPEITLVQTLEELNRSIRSWRSSTLGNDGYHIM
jgi:Nucleoside 2-deoxyribosyltransferase like